MIVRNSILFLLLLFTVQSSSLYSQTDPVVKEIKAVMADQQDAWNKGDIPRFMDHYWASPELVFLGESGPIYGWQKTIDRYYKKYPDRQAMGQLQFTIGKITKRSDTVYSVIGQYYLTREGIEDLNGHFLLIVQHMEGRWLIVADSTM